MLSLGRAFLLDINKGDHLMPSAQQTSTAANGLIARSFNGHILTILKINCIIRGLVE